MSNRSPAPPACRQDAVRCFLAAVPESGLIADLLARAADLLARAADALLRYDFAHAAALLAECDFSSLGRYRRSIVSQIDPLIHGRTNNPLFTRMPAKADPHMPKI